MADLLCHRRFFSFKDNMLNGCVNQKQQQQHFFFYKYIVQHLDLLCSLIMWFWCPCMAINVSVQYNGGLLPEIILLTLCDYIGEPF